MNRKKKKALEFLTELSVDIGSNTDLALMVYIHMILTTHIYVL